MKFPRLLSILFTSVTTGLAAAFIVVLLNPELISTPDKPTPLKLTGSAPHSYADAVEITAPSVVNIFATKLTRERHSQLEELLALRFFGKSLAPKIRKENSLGSGVVVADNGYILTNHHVIADADKISIGSSDGKTVTARLVGSDPDTDIAVLQAAGESLPIAPIGKSSTLRVGDVVLAIGNPFAVGQTVTQGIVSATDRHSLGIATYENFIQTDAAINPGNSGGALINVKGEVIGINTAIFSKSGGSQGIGFAVPIDLASTVMKQIISHGKVLRGWIGLNGQNLTPNLAESLNTKVEHGVLVSAVLNNGPADIAGVLPGDVIHHINSEKMLTSTQILNFVGMTSPGENMRLSIDRQGKQMQIDIKVMERPSEIP